jgi:hypothetical protein
MNFWSNIEVTPDDPEIKQIHKLEQNLGQLPSNVNQIRELITGFEVCHFKFQQHIRYLKESILNLKPNISLKQIGSNHIRHSENAWMKDKSGRSLSGQSYVWGLKKWLGYDLENKNGLRNLKLEQKILKWLGKKIPEKERLVQLLIARLKWDWESHEKLTGAEENKELEFQVCRMDICHYNFPRNMDQVIQGIGKLEPVQNFEGCGSYNPDIKMHIKKEFLELNKWSKSILSIEHPDKLERIRLWLIFCLSKTMKEQTGITLPIEGLSR